MFNRRGFVATSSLGLAGTLVPSLSSAVARSGGPGSIADIQERAFRFFWETTDPRTGLAPDRWPTLSFSSIAATGFALTAYPIGVVNRWISRAQARERTLTTLRFLWRLPQGPGATDVAGYKGFFYHFLDMTTGLRFARCELSSIDTTLLLGGVLFAGQWFDADDPEEAAIRDLAAKLYARCDWGWFQDRKPQGDPRLSMGWHPESGFIARRWFGYTEAMLAYVLALGAPRHAIDADAWGAWTSTYRDVWRGEGTGRFLAFAPQFGHQYSHVWIDFRGIRDEVMRAEGFDYFENSRRATYAQRAYAIANPGGWRGYSRDIWGLTACDGPGDFAAKVAGRERRFFGYSARGPIGQPDGRDDGTIAPTAALGSIAFAPEIVEPVARAMHDRYGAAIYGRYGFLDSFNPTLVNSDAPIARGKIVRGMGWVDDDYLGIDQGPIVAGIENAKSGLIWRTMCRNPAIRRGLTRAGFTGGWLADG